MSADLSDWSQREGEAPGDWLARLEHVDQSGLGHAQRAHLAVLMQSAERLARRAGPSAPRPSLLDQPVPQVPAPSVSPLEQVKAAVRALDLPDRQQLVLWLAWGMPEGE